MSATQKRVSMSQGATDVALNPQIYLSVSQASSLTLPITLVWVCYVIYNAQLFITFE